jgi:hypothetical protein
MSPLVGDGGDEVQELGVALFDAVDRAAGEESLPEEADEPLDDAFLLRFADTAEADGSSSG